MNAVLRSRSSTLFFNKIKMDQTLSKINEYLQSKKSIAVVTPKDPNVDQMAAALSLYLSLSLAGKQVTIATPSDPLVELSHLFGIDKVKTSLGGASGDLVVSFPYKEGEIDKVSYTLEDGFLNIVVKAGELGFSFDQKDVKYVRPQAAPELLFIIGASKLSDLGRLFDPAALKDTAVVNIDNNSQNQGFGDIVMVSTRLSSVSEQVANMILNLNLTMDLDIAQNLFEGITYGTQNFQSPNTSALALEMAGVLMRHGAKRESVAREMATTAFNRNDFVKDQNLQGLYGEKSPQVQNQNVQSSPIRQAQGEPAQNAQNQNNQTQQPDLNNPPEDWLTPKVYKGSTNF